MAVYTQSERESFIRRCPWRAKGWMLGILLSGSTPDAKTALRYQHPEMDGIRAAVDALLAAGRGRCFEGAGSQ